MVISWSFNGDLMGLLDIIHLVGGLEHGWNMLEHFPQELRDDDPI